MELPSDLRVLVRGWMHGNVVSIGSDVVDSGYHTDPADLLAFVSDCETLALTHVHSDHAGGTAALVDRFGCRVHAHRDAAALVERWDPRELWLVGTGQHLPRFTVDAVLGDSIALGGERWEVIDTPGHAVGGVSFFRARDGVLIAGDALWRDGFGLLNPWFDPPGVFERTRATLQRLSALPVQLVIPGHGAPFADVREALDRAKSRLAYLEANPDRHRAQLERNLLGFWKLMVPDATEADLDAQRAAMHAVFTP